MAQRVRVGVIGCGAIAQIHHLPNLVDIDGFELAAVCDVSAALVGAIAERYGVDHAVTDYVQLLETSIDAVVCCHSDPKTEVVLAALRAGKHVFVEKPVCFSQRGLTELKDAADEAGVVAQAAYVKAYDPAFEIAQREVSAMSGVKLAMANHVHTDNLLHTRQYDLLSFDDVPKSHSDELARACSAEIVEELGELPDDLLPVFFCLSGSVVHDLYSLRYLLDRPSRVLSATTYAGGSGITLTLEYPRGVRGIVNWIDLARVWHFDETLSVYADDRRVVLDSPTGFARGLVTGLTIEGVDADGASYRREPQVPWETAFRRELVHFYDCVVEGTPCRTPIADAGHELSVVADATRLMLAAG